MHARVSTRTLASQVIEMNGNRGIISLMDRETGKSMSITLWEDEEALRATEQSADQVRSEAAKTSDGEIRSVERFEVSIFEVQAAGD